MIICENRLRQVPKQFSWIDQKLVREGYIDRLSHHAMALYLFLLTVSDASGVSYYADKTLERRLSLSRPKLKEARACLIQESLIAYQRPFYQALALTLPAKEDLAGIKPSKPQSDAGPKALKQILKALEQKSDDRL